MSVIGRDKLLDCLFSGQDRTLVNVKFCRGTDDFIAIETFRDEFCASVQRHKESFRATKGYMPKCKKKAVDLTSLVSDM